MLKLNWSMMLKLVLRITMRAEEFLNFFKLSGCQETYKFYNEINSLLKLEIKLSRISLNSQALISKEYNK